jgi:hypothetical protein
MGERTEQIKDQIETQRQELGENLGQLEEKVKETMDWRSQFEQHPMMGVGIAFAGGFLLSALLPSGGGSSDSRSRSYDMSSDYRIQDESQSWQGAGSGYSSGFTSQPQQQKQRSPEMKEVNETVENIRGAMMGLAATRLRSFLAEAVPGFETEYEEARRKRGNSESSRIQGDGSSSQSTSSQSQMGRDMSSGQGSMGDRMTGEQQSGSGMETQRG